MKADEIKMEIAIAPREIRMPPRFKKTRRGKKRRLNSFSPEEEKDVINPAHSPAKYDNGNEYDPCEMEHSQKRTCPSVSCFESSLDDATSVPPTCTQNGFKRPMLRPLDVPKAPNNSTQYIMDDHENCNLYFSFESPRCRRRRRSTGASCSDGSGESGYSPCNGYQDIDYEYESPDDLDSAAFLERDFEIIYRRAREDELVNLSRVQLIEQFIEMEDKALSYEQLLRGSLPSVAQLQEELLKLQEENAQLRKTNWCLKDRSFSGTSDSDGEVQITPSRSKSDPVFPSSP